MDQKMPSNESTYWEFLNKIFNDANSKLKAGESKEKTDQFVLDKLEILRNAILKMPLLPSFTNDFKSKFSSVSGKGAGQVPVFIRSDTNMEDLKDFTGAGLNLTLFNVLEEDKIFQGIKQVWASALILKGASGGRQQLSVKS